MAYYEEFVPQHQGQEEAIIAEAKIITTLRFDADLLRAIDRAAKKRGISRTAWIMIAASRAIDEGL